MSVLGCIGSWNPIYTNTTPQYWHVLWYCGVYQWYLNTYSRYKNTYHTMVCIFTHTICILGCNLIYSTHVWHNLHEWNHYCAFICHTMIHPKQTNVPGQLAWLAVTAVVAIHRLSSGCRSVCLVGFLLYWSSLTDPLTLIYCAVSVSQSDIVTSTFYWQHYIPIYSAKKVPFISWICTL